MCQKAHHSQIVSVVACSLRESKTFTLESSLFTGIWDRSINILGEWGRRLKSVTALNLAFACVYSSKFVFLDELRLSYFVLLGLTTESRGSLLMCIPCSISATCVTSPTRTTASLTFSKVVLTAEETRVYQIPWEKQQRKLQKKQRSICFCWCCVWTCLWYVCLSHVRLSVRPSVPS